MTDAVPVYEAHGLRKLYPVRGGLLTALRLRPVSHVHAVDGIDVRITAAEVLGVLGESGCGKSTLGRLLVHLEERTAGEAVFQGKAVDAWMKNDPRGFRRRVQIVFQNPYEAFDDRFAIGAILRDPLQVHGIGEGAAERGALVTRALEDAGLRPAADYSDRYPHELSGGQLQRVALARALLLQPALLVADEPVSMLDVSVRVGIMNLLLEMRERVGTAVVFITHDVAVARYLSDRAMVMYLGQVMEEGPAAAVLDDPRHPYTRALVEHTPTPDVGTRRDRTLLPGEPGTPVDPGPGCRFAARCPIVQPICRIEAPALRSLGDGRRAACHFAEPREKRIAGDRPA